MNSFECFKVFEFIEFLLSNRLNEICEFFLKLIFITTLKSMWSVLNKIIVVLTESKYYVIKTAYDR